MKGWGSTNSRVSIWFIYTILLVLVVVLQFGCNRSEVPAVANELAAISVPSPQPTLEPSPPEMWNDAYNVVNGIRIGSSYAELKQNLGKPVSEKRGGENACGSAKTIVAYKGINFTLDDDGKSNHIVLIEITSPEWEMAPGVKTGMTLEQVRSKMGRDGLHRQDEVETLTYADGDGYLTFQFAGGKVAKITRDLNLC